MPIRDNTAKRLVKAVMDLMDEQNGPPLYSRADYWRAAMVNAKDAILAAGDELGLDFTLGETYDKQLEKLG